MCPNRTDIHRFFRRNPRSGALQIETALDTYDDLFNEWDPAPFKRRDLDPDLHRYLDENIRTLPQHVSLELVFRLPRSVRNDAREAESRLGMQAYFQYEAEVIRRDLRALSRRTAVHLSVAVVLLSAATLLARLPWTGLGADIVREGVTIGAWVFTWESLSSFFFGRFRIQRHYRKWRRIAGAPVRFEYDPGPESD